jgi:hypothetical protein
MSLPFLSMGELFTGKPTFDNLKKGIEAALATKKEKSNRKSIDPDKGL